MYSTRMREDRIILSSLPNTNVPTKMLVQYSGLTDLPVPARERIR